MKITNIKKRKGFTLIELLVVITIIGILATGGTIAFSGYIQKSRDATRVSDISAIQKLVEGSYEEDSAYPGGDKFAERVASYIGDKTLPKDPKHGEPCTSTGGTQPACAYLYRVGDSSNGISNGAYEVSVAFENIGNIRGKAKNDSGNDDVRFETGLRINAIDTVVSDSALTVDDGICGVGGSPVTGVSDIVVINGGTGTSCS